ncbi:unnamed protein product [Durusdinium trenchii]|uniref:Uncharacterized protein n=1 Tax=Durusdinium trenchii TaxID=1381693 RepID=A0ABP0QA41_9DINO
MVFAFPQLAWTPLDHAELFAGKMAVSLAEMEESRRCASLDLEYGGECMDFMTNKGFVHAVYTVLRLSPGSSLTLAPVCSTWVWMSRGSTKRSKALPLGDDSAPSVALGNTMVARCALLLFLAAARGIWFVLEQPRGSLLEYHPAMQRVLKLVRVWRKHVRMGDFAAPTEKGTWLYSSRPEIEELHKFKPKCLPAPQEEVQLVDHYVDSRGQKRVKGNRALKKSQAYTIQFGRALARLRSRHIASVRREARQFLRSAAKGDAKPFVVTKDMAFWCKHANLDPVFEFLA